MKKIAYVVNYFTNDNVPTENDNITIFLSEEDKKQNSFSTRFPYENVEHATYVMFDNLFMELKKLQDNGYELKFVCEEK